MAADFLEVSQKIEALTLLLQQTNSKGTSEKQTKVKFHESISETIILPITILMQGFMLASIKLCSFGIHYLNISRSLINMNNRRRTKTISAPCRIEIDDKNEEIVGDSFQEAASKG